MDKIIAPSCEADGYCSIFIQGKTTDSGYEPVASSKRYYAGIDGLRLLAIVSVLIYHANPTRLPGGFSGVTLFFVITGYLLTASVDRELHEKGSFSYVDHLKRRIARLLPAMLVVVGTTALLSIIFARPLVPKMKGDVIPALLFVQNWHYILRNVSYFAASGLPSPLTHFWYLAVVMQFYIVWPIVLLVMDKLRLRRRTRVAICAILAIAAQIEMAILFDPSADTNRVYYGLDTRMGELLMGAVVAQLAPIVSARKRTSARVAARRGSRTAEPVVSDAVLTIAGLVGLVFFIVFSFVINGYSHFPYRGGFMLLAIASAALVLACIRDTTILARIFGLPPISALGKRSFSLYLWHYPLLLIMNPATRTTDLTVVQRALQFVAIFAVTEVSYRIFEWRRTVTEPGSRRAEPRKTTIVGLPTVSRILSIAGIIFSVILFFVPEAPQQTAEAKPSLVVDIESAVEDEVRKSKASTETELEPARERVFYPVEGTLFEGTGFEAAINTINSFSHYEIDDETGACNAPILLIGDSVPLGAETQFYEMFPYGHMDSQVSRSIYAGREVLQSMWDQGMDGDAVIFALGNNGVCYEEDVIDLIEMCGDRHVYLVTARVPLALQDMNNSLFWDIASRYKNVDVIDWYSYSAGHDEYFWDDGTHLRPEGADAYCLMLREAIAGR